MIGRRALLGWFAVTVVTPARPQSPAIPVIGIMVGGTPEAHAPFEAVIARLRALGWVEGRTVRYEVRFASADPARAAKIVAEFAQMGAAVIITPSIQYTRLAMAATDARPIVFAGVADPVGSGLVASLGRPGGNVTGLSNQLQDLAAKRLALLAAIVPSVRRVALVANAQIVSYSPEIAGFNEAASAVGVETRVVPLQDSAAIATAVASLSGEVDGAFAMLDPYMSANHRAVNAAALAIGLPMVHSVADWVRSGGLMAYGYDLADLWGRAGDYADRILRGASPAELPVEQPTKFHLALNLAAAHALKLTIPLEIIAQADEMIE